MVQYTGLGYLVGLGLLTIVVGPAFCTKWYEKSGVVAAGLACVVIAFAIQYF